MRKELASRFIKGIKLSSRLFQETENKSSQICINMHNALHKGSPFTTLPLSLAMALTAGNTKSTPERFRASHWSESQPSSIVGQLRRVRHRKHSDALILIHSAFWILECQNSPDSKQRETRDPVTRDNNKRYSNKKNKSHMHRCTVAPPSSLLVQALRGTVQGHQLPWTAFAMVNSVVCGWTTHEEPSQA